MLERQKWNPKPKLNTPCFALWCSHCYWAVPSHAFPDFPFALFQFILLSFEYLCFCVFVYFCCFVFVYLCLHFFPRFGLALVFKFFSFLKTCKALLYIWFFCVSEFSNPLVLVHIVFHCIIVFSEFLVFCFLQWVGFACAGLPFIMEIPASWPEVLQMVNK